MPETERQIEEIADEALDGAQGGIALLVPAVQKVREAAARVSITDGASNAIAAAAGDGSV